MKRLFVLVLGIAALAINMCQAAPPLRLFLAVSSTPDIRKFTARRASNKILLEGVIRNQPLGKAETLNVSWTITRAVGAGWVPVRSGVATLKPNQEITVSAIADSTKAERFKLEVTAKTGSGPVTKTAFAGVAANIFIVQYRLPEWKSTFFHQSNPRQGLIGAEARAYAQRLNDMGLQTSIKYTHKHTEAFVTYWDAYTQEVFYRCVNWSERTFSTEAAARQFRDGLPAGVQRQLVLR